MTTARQKKHMLVNLFGALGYLSCAAQWIWTGAIFLPLLLENQAFRNFLLPNPADPVAEPVIAAPAPFIMIIIGILITVFILGLTVLILIRLPAAVAKTSSKAVASTASKAAPVVAHNKHLSQPQAKRLTAKLVIYIKLLACTLPVAVLASLPFVDVSLSKGIVLFVACMLSLASISWFTLQYLVARSTKMPSDQII